MRSQSWKKDLQPQISVIEGGKVQLTSLCPTELMSHHVKEHLLQ
ncbi:hypothetical protein CEXT_815911, partial [Caerostris extrusa]